MTEPKHCIKCNNEIDQTKQYYSGTDEQGKVGHLCPKCAGRTEDTTIVVKPPLVSNQTAILPNSEGVTGLLPGEQNELHTQQLVRETHRNFLTIGKLLFECRENAYWSTAGRWESFSNYIESLGISKSAGYSMIASFQTLGQLSEDEILEIGIAKMGLLIGAGKVEDADTVELAKVSPVRDFKQHLGHKLLTNDPNHSIICPHCGVAIEGAQFVRLKSVAPKAK